MPPSAPTLQPPAEGFFLLPSEIRNQIYSYVLTLPNRTLEYTNNDLSGHKQINQLQNVCKQLYQECHCLELLYNPTITFSCGVHERIVAVEQLLTFLVHVPPEKLLWIKVVELRSVAIAKKLSLQIAEPKYLLFQLADICRWNPHLTVKYRIPPSYGFSSSAFQIMVWGSVYSNILRGDALQDLWPATMSRREEWLLGLHYTMGRQNEWAGYNVQMEGPRPEDVARLQANNLRFYPMEDFHFLRGGVFGPLHTWFRDDAKTQDLMPIWEATVRRWVEDGF